MKRLIVATIMLVSLTVIVRAVADASKPSASAPASTPFYAAVPVDSNLQFSAPTFDVKEGNVATVTVTRIGGAKGVVKVDYCAYSGAFDTAFAVFLGRAETSDGISGDYVPVRSRIRNLGLNPVGWPYNIAAVGTLVFEDGQTTKSFTISTLPHKAPEGDVHLTMVLRNPQGSAALGKLADARLVITEAHAPPAGVLQFDSPLYHAKGAAGTKTVTVTRTGGSSGEISVAYATVAAHVTVYTDQTLTTSKVAVPAAAADTDYTSVKGVLKWADGDASPKTFAVRTQDSKSAGIKNVALALSNPTGGAILGSCKSADLYLLGARTPGGQYTLCNRNTFKYAKDGKPHVAAGSLITVWLPQDTPVVSGVLFPADLTPFDVAQEVKAFCQSRGLAIVRGLVHAYEIEDPVQIANLEDCLNQVAAATFHPEIANAPFASEGVSGVGGAPGWANPDRALGFVAISGGHLRNGGVFEKDPYEKFFEHSPMPEGTKSVPGIFINGEEDDAWDPCTKLVRRALIESYFTSLRSQGELVAYAIDWHVGHCCGPQAQDLAWYYLDQVIKLRNPSGLRPGVNPGERVPLRKLTENDGWLGEKPSLDRAANSGFLTIAPAAKYPAKPETLASWLPTEGVANAYRALTSLNMPLAKQTPFQTPLTITPPDANRALTPGKITFTVDPRTFANVKMMECFDANGTNASTLKAAPWTFTVAMPLGVHAVSIVATDANDRKVACFETFYSLPEGVRTAAELDPPARSAATSKVAE